MVSRLLFCWIVCIFTYMENLCGCFIFNQMPRLFNHFTFIESRVNTDVSRVVPFLSIQISTLYTVFLIKQWIAVFMCSSEFPYLKFLNKLVFFCFVLSKLNKYIFQMNISHAQNNEILELQLDKIFNHQQYSYEKVDIYSFFFQFYWFEFALWHWIEIVPSEVIKIESIRWIWTGIMGRETL